MSSAAHDDFASCLQTLERHGRTVWLGQSVDTSVLHSTYHDYAELPILTSVGCVIRRPVSISAKFDEKLRQRVGAGGRLRVDSGGFVLMMKPELGWDVSKVANIYERIDADSLISLDVPASTTDSIHDRKCKYETTSDNLAYLVDRLGPNIVPVAHGVTLDELDRNCRRILEILPAPAVVGLGGLVPTLQLCGAVRRLESNAPQRRIVDSVACVRAHFPQASLHLFGVGSVNTVLGAFAAGIDSVDSIGWRQAAGFGSVFIPGRPRRLLTNRVRERPCRPFANAEDLKELATCCCPVCRSAENESTKFEMLAGHFKPRAAHNIWVLYWEAANYLRARDRGEESKFLSRRLSEAWLGALES